jgi:predicted DNA-binding protein
MGNFKKTPKYNVVSIRISDEEKLVLEGLMQHNNKSISILMREAIQLYTPQLNKAIR